MQELTYLQAIVIGLLQGATELFPVSSLGHSVLVPALFGGSWQHLVTESATSSSEHSSYLAFIVALHVATALALLGFYREQWLRLIKAFFVTLKTRQARTTDERLIWLIIVATIPVGLIGLALEHPLRVLFAKPLAAATLLIINGLILFAAERMAQSARVVVKNRGTKHITAMSVPDSRSPEELTYREAGVIGLFQSLALLAGISRSGITLAAGLTRGLDRENAANFAFLLATPVILAAGLLKLPSLFGSAGDGIHGQVLVGAVTAGVTAYLSVRFLTRYFHTRTLKPFAIYSVIFGLICLIRFSL